MQRSDVSNTSSICSVTEIPFDNDDDAEITHKHQAEQKKEH